MAHGCGAARSVLKTIPARGMDYPTRSSTGRLCAAVAAWCKTLPLGHAGFGGGLGSRHRRDGAVLSVLHKLRL